MVERETPKKLRTTAGDILACSNVKDRVGKMRFDYYHASGGDRAGSVQGRTVAAEPRAGHTRPMSQRYLIHATRVDSDRRIVRECIRLISGRREFRLADAMLNIRRLNYLRDPSGKNGMRMLIDLHDARLQ